MDIPKTLADLNADPINPRYIDDLAKAGLTHSMEEFGDLSGLVYNIRTKHLVCGHQRKTILPQTAKIQDWKEIKDNVGTVATAAVVVKGRRWPIRVVDWDESRERAANITANNSQIAGKWTADLNGLLEQIAEETPALYDSTLMHKLLDEIEDDAPEKRARSEGEPEYDLSPQPYESYNYVLLIFKTSIDWATAMDYFEVKKVIDSTSGKIGVGHVLDGAAFLEKKLGHLWNPKSKS